MTAAACPKITTEKDQRQIQHSDVTLVHGYFFCPCPCSYIHVTRSPTYTNTQTRRHVAFGGLCLMAAFAFELHAACQIQKMIRSTRLVRDYGTYNTNSDLLSLSGGQNGPGGGGRLAVFLQGSIVSRQSNWSHIFSECECCCCYCWLLYVACIVQSK